MNIQLRPLYPRKRHHPIWFYHQDKQTTNPIRLYIAEQFILRHNSVEHNEHCFPYRPHLHIKS